MPEPAVGALIERNLERAKGMDKMTPNEPQPAKIRRVRHDVADSIAVMSFSLGASLTIAILLAVAFRVA